jgi:DNA polymerase-3 subunit beta
MDLTAPRRDLLSAIETALPASDHGSAMPILHSLQVTCLANGSVTIIGSDLLVSCTARTQAKVKKAGSACIPGKLLRDVVARMKEGDVTLSVVTKGGGASLSIKGVGMRAATSIPTMPGEDYPSVPMPEGEIITIPAATLAAILKITKATASPDDTRPHLAAVMLQIEGKKIRAVSTDGHRMSIVARPLESSSVAGPWLIPLPFLTRAKMPEEGDITLSAKHKQGPLTFQWGPEHARVTWTTKLVDAAFPSYDQVIPSRWDMAVSCSREELLESFRAVSLVASDRTSGVKLIVKTVGNKDTILLHSESPDRGEMDDDLPCEIWKGNDPGAESKREIFIGLNADYVTQALSTLPGERVTLCMTAELDPLRLECADEPGYIGIIMPMRV